MSMRRLILLFHTLRHTRREQVMRRVAYVVRRRLRRWGAAWGLAPGAWYRAPAPEESPREGWAPVRFPVASSAGGTAGTGGAPSPARAPSASVALPLSVQLPGHEWVVDETTRWRRPHVDSLSPLARLTLHYMEFLPRLTAGPAVTVMLDWIQANPPYVESDDWSAAWNSYAISIRTVIWMDLLKGPLAPIGMDPVQRTRLLQSLAAQLRFLADNLETDIGGNHLVKNIRALVRGGRFFQGDEAKEWLRVGLDLLERELKEQILPDGMHFERSPAYHLQVLGDLLDMRAALGSGSFPEGVDGSTHRLDDALARMLGAANLLTHPDGKPSLFADGGLHMTHAPGDLLAAAHELGISAPEEPAPGAWSLPDAGYFGLWVKGPPGDGEEEEAGQGEGAESGKVTDDLLVVDCGPVGPDHLPAHGHGDALSFEWTVAGVRVVVDAGVAEYQGPLRPYSRSTAAHNTVTVDDADQSEFWSAFRVARRAGAQVEEWGAEPPARGGIRGGTTQGPAPPFRLVGSHDGYRRLAGSPVHRREIEAGPGWLRVADEVVGGKGQTVRARLLLGPSIEVRLVEGGAILTVAAVGFPGDSSGLTIHLSTSGAVTLERGLWMPDFGARHEVWRVVLEYGNAPTAGGFELRVEGKAGQGELVGE